MEGASTAVSYGIQPAGYRLPAAAHVGRVRLAISNLEQSIRYYELILGLRVIERGDGWAVMGPRGASNALVELHEQAGVRPMPRRGLLGLYHFAILLPTRTDLARFVDHLGELNVYAGMSDHFVSEAIYLQDPDGLGIEVYADRPRSTWRFEQRQLAMATEPLNVRDLLATAAGTRWDGAPTGTTMGHIHLFVGDIEQASQFYHNALGFDKIVWNYPGALFMSAGGYHHHLGTNTWAAGAPSASENDARLLEWELVVPEPADVDRIAASMIAAGQHVDRDGDAALVADPWGTRLRLISASGI